MISMKKVIMMMIVAAALTVLPATAQEWQSTSSMQGTGSSLTPQVTAVGATTAQEMATTTTTSVSTPAHTHGSIRRITPVTPEGDPTPLGDAVLPLMLCIAVYGVARGLRRKARQEGDEYLRI